MKKWWIVPFVFVGGGLAFLASAFCPLCAAGVVVGLGISHWLGIDDSVTGIWLGGLLVMLTMWTIGALKRRSSNFVEWWQGVVFSGYYLIVLAPLWALGKIGHPLNRLWGMDKLLLGIATGTVMTYLAISLHYWLKKHNDNRHYFKFQRTVIIFASLILFSALFYLLTKNYVRQI